MKLSKIRITDVSGVEIFKGSCMHLPFEEDYIIQKSIEMFNDSEPCIINRTAAINMIGLEITQFFLEQSNKHNERASFEWDSISNKFENILNFKTKLKTIEVEFI